MSNHHRGLLLRVFLAFFGFVLALESFFLKPNIKINLPSISIPSSNYDSSPSWSNDHNNNDYDSGGGWNSGGGGDSGWDSGGGGWDGGGDSGSWDSDGGDSGSW